MTKCVVLHVNVRQPAHSSATTKSVSITMFSVPFPTVAASTIVKMAIPTTVSAGSAKNNQCGCTSTTMSSSWLSSWRGNGMSASVGPGGASRRQGASGPAELFEAGVVDPEVVGDLVHDRDADLAHNVGLVGAHPADGQPKDRDPIRHRQPVVRDAVAGPLGERDAFVQAEQAGPALVLDKDGNVVDVGAERLGDAVER